MSSGSLYVDTGTLPWRDSPYEGVHWKKLHFDPEGGRSAVLLRFAPGASYGTHRHPEGEEYLVLEGSLEDGGRTSVTCPLLYPTVMGCDVVWPRPTPACKVSTARTATIPRRFDIHKGFIMKSPTASYSSPSNTACTHTPKSPYCSRRWRHWSLRM